jgi:hypothetical protein
MDVPPDFHKDFLDMPRAEAWRRIECYEKLEPAPGHVLVWELTHREDSPDNTRVNICLYSRKGVTP